MATEITRAPQVAYDAAMKAYYVAWFEHDRLLGLSPNMPGIADQLAKAAHALEEAEAELEPLWGALQAAIAEEEALERDLREVPLTDAEVDRRLDDPDYGRDYDDSAQDERDRRL